MPAPAVLVTVGTWIAELLPRGVRWVKEKLQKKDQADLAHIDEVVKRIEEDR